MKYLEFKCLERGCGIYFEIETDQELQHVEARCPGCCVGRCEGETELLKVSND